MQKSLSYISGWLSSLSWLVGVASGQYLTGNIVPALVTLHDPTFTPDAWKGYVILMAFLAFCFVVNGYFSRYLHLVEGVLLFLVIVAYISVMVTMVVLSPKLSGTEVFTNFEPYDASVTTLEVIPAQVFLFFCLGGFDSCVHLAEETQNASTVIPKAIIWAYCINGVLVFAMLITVCFCWVDPDLYLNSKSGFPFLDLLTTATQSTSKAITIGGVLVALLVLAIVNYMASTSRQVFAFARDNGLPFSGWAGAVNRKTRTPINALIFVVVFSLLINLIGRIPMEYLKPNFKPPANVTAI